MEAAGILVHKSSGASSADRTDGGTNTASLTDPALNGVAIFPRATINAISTEFRATSNNGWKLFWKNCPYYTTDSHSGVSCPSILSQAELGRNIRGWVRDV